MARAWFAVLAVAIATSGATVAAAPAAAAVRVIDVTTTTDTQLEGASPACTGEEAAEAKQCSLRIALERAEEQSEPTSSAIVVSVPAGVYELSKGPLVVGNANAASCEGAATPCSVTLEGAGAGLGSGASVIDGKGATGLVRTPIGSGPVTIAKLTLEHGNAEGGGAVVANAGASGSSLTISESLLSENKSSGAGGAIAVKAGADVRIAASTLSKNEALESAGKGGEGGAIAVSGGTLAVADSTLAENRADVSGGAIALTAPAATTATVTDTTLAANAAPLGGTIATTEYPLALDFVTLSGSKGGPAVETTAGPVTIEGSILYQQAPGGEACKSAASEAVMALGANIVFPVPTEKQLKEGACTFSGTAPLASDPRLGALAPANGLGATRALERGSPAVNAAGASCPGAQVAGTARDERGRTRPQGPACDIGAFEVAGDGAVALQPLPATLAAGATVSLAGVVEDRGEDGIGAATVAVKLPAGVTLGEAVAGCSQTGAEGAVTVTCVLGEVKAAQAVAFSLPLHFVNAGAASLTATVAATQADFDPANDSATVVANVGGAPPVVHEETPVVQTPPPPGETPTNKQPTSKVSLSRTLFTVDSHSTVALRVSCTARTTGGCTDTIGVYTSAGKLPASVAAGAKATLLARAKIQVAGGKTVTVHLHLSAAAQRLLKGKRSIPARLLVTVQVAAGTTSHAYNITLKKTAVKKRKR